MPTADLARLASIARDCRVQIIRMLTHAGSGHPGGSLSVIDILTTLLFARMRYDPKRPDWPDRDRVVLSKGHAVQGLSVAMGMALGLRLDGRPSRVYCVLGDGEIQEGQVWEAAMEAPKLGQPDHPLDNLCVILDYNKIQLDDFVKKVLDLEPVLEKWKGFGWPVLEIDGHDLTQIDKALDQAEAIKGRPTFIVAHTVKGKSVSFMENDPEWHGKAPKPQEGIRAIREILGVAEGDWTAYLGAHAETAAIFKELEALEKK